MARREPVEITLGERTFKIKPLTLNQVEAIEGMMDGAKAVSQVHLARSVIAEGLRRDNADVAIGDLECTVAELALAMTAILRQGGFMPEGEAPAAAMNASTSQDSEAA